MMRSSYSIQLVLLSYVIAVLASHVTLSLAQRLRPIDDTRRAHMPLHWPWIAGGAFSMGAAIVSMHVDRVLSKPPTMRELRETSAQCLDARAT